MLRSGVIAKKVGMTRLFMDDGKQRINWEADDMVSGIYYLKITSGQNVARLKMIRR